MENPSISNSDRNDYSSELDSDSEDLQKPVQTSFNVSDYSEPESPKISISNLNSPNFNRIKSHTKNHDFECLKKTSIMFQEILFLAKFGIIF